MATSELPRQGANVSANRIDFTAARQAHLLHLQSPLFRACLGLGMKVSKKQHEQTSTGTGLSVARPGGRGEGKDESRGGWYPGPTEARKIGESSKHWVLAVSAFSVDVHHQ